MNTISGARAYEQPPAKVDEPKKENEKTNTPKPAEKKSEDTAAAVYEKSAKEAKKAPKTDVNMVNMMKADMLKRKDQLRGLVEKMLGKQGKAFTSAKEMWEMLRNGSLEVDPVTAAQAQADIAEDGYWGVEQTSDRLVSFAKALAGNDPAYADELLAAMKKGFEQATGEWGDKLPDICQKTMEAAEKKMEAWKNGEE